MLFDRYTNSSIHENQLPKSIDLGRFLVYGDNGTFELCNSSFNVNKELTIHEQLLMEENKSVHDILLQIRTDVKEGNFQSIPLIQGIKGKLEPTKFEDELHEHLDNLQAIFHNPHSLLDRTIEKVPVARVKRIAAKSNQYLSCHTEDWEHRSIISFRPKRILSEELELNFNVYENQLLIAFVQRAVLKLSQRLKEVSDITDFLNDYAKMFDKYTNKKGWHRRNERDLWLAGKVYEQSDDNYTGGEDKNKSLVEGTRLRIEKMLDKLRGFMALDLFFLVDKRVTQGITYHDTNVLINHQHYRHLKTLWYEMYCGENEEQTSPSELDQKVIQSLQSYGTSLITYAVRETLGYQDLMEGTDTSWQTCATDGTVISFKQSKENVLLLSIGEDRLRFIVTGNVPQDVELSSDSYIIAFDNDNRPSDSEPGFHIIPVSLKDLSSAERIAKIIRSYLLKQYVQKIRTNISYPSLLRSFIKGLNIQGIHFDFDRDSFQIQALNLSSPSGAINTYIRQNDDYAKQNSKEKERINAAADSLILSINNQINALNRLKGFDTEDYIQPWMCKEACYLKCTSDNEGFIVDSVSYPTVKFFFDNDLKNELSKEDWGIDYLEFNIESL